MNVDRKWGALVIIAIALLVGLLFIFDAEEKPISTVTAVPVATSSPTATNQPASPPPPAGTAVPTSTEIAREPTETPSPTATRDATATAVPTAVPPTAVVHIVIPGDTMSQIVYDACGSAVSWPVMCEANDMLQPYQCHRIYPGMELILVCE